MIQFQSVRPELVPLACNALIPGLVGLITFAPNPTDATTGRHSGAMLAGEHGTGNGYRGLFTMRYRWGRLAESPCVLPGFHTLSVSRPRMLPVPPNVSVGIQGEINATLNSVS